MLVLSLKIFILTLFAIAVNSDDNDGCKKKTSHLPTARLKADLLCDYDPMLRPVVNHTNTTTVTIKMILKYFTYDMHESTISIHNWMVLIWKDEHLQWTPSDYESITQIHIHNQEIWTPDLSVYNTHQVSGSTEAVSAVECLLLHTGTVICVSPLGLTALCTPNISKFPYDRQNCTLRLGSWVHSGEEIDLSVSKNAISLEDTLPNSDWKLISIDVVKHPGHFNCCPDNTYPYVNYNFVIERHSGTHSATIVIPALVLIVLTLLTMWMDMADNNRLMIACCNFIAHTLFIETIYFIVPAGGENPALIVIFLRDSLLMCTISLILTVILKKFLNNPTPCNSWVSNTISVVLSLPYGEFLISKETAKRSTTFLNDEDTANIISNETTSNPGVEDRKLFVNLINTLGLIGYSIIYLWMAVSWLP